MASDRVTINEMASAVMESLTEYADLAADEMKKAVQAAGKTVKKEIEATAPKDTGAYAKSWAVKKNKRDIAVDGGCGVFQNEISAGSSLGAWSRTSKRRTGKSLSAYRSG